jgi:hypothetical protein
MVAPQLLEYVEKERLSGSSDSQIRDLLCKNGWTPADVDEIFFEIDNTVPPEPKLNPNAFSQPMDDLQPQQFNQNNINYIEQDNNKNMSKTFLTLLIILLVLFVGWGVYFGLPYLMGYLKSSQTTGLTTEEPINEQPLTAISIPEKIMGKVYSINNREITIISTDSNVYTFIIWNDETIFEKNIATEKMINKLFSDIKNDQEVEIIPENTVVEDITKASNASSITILSK